MEQPGSGDRPEPRQEGLASRLPWRYGPPGRRQLAALAMARQRTPGGGTAAKAAGERGGYDIDDHIRLAVREESAATLGRAGSRLQEAVAALGDFDRGSKVPARRMPADRCCTAPRARCGNSSSNGKR